MDIMTINNFQQVSILHAAATSTLQNWCLFNLAGVPGWIEKGVKRTSDNVDERLPNRKNIVSLQCFLALHMYRYAKPLRRLCAGFLQKQKGNAKNGI
jgi:hypothetical protein